MFALVASAASPDECAFLAKRFSAFPQPGRGAWKRVFVNATFEPRADGPRHYPTADDIFKLFYHGRRSPYHGMQQHADPRAALRKLTFSFATKYGGPITEWVLQALGGPPAFAVEVGSYLGSSAVRTWGPLVRRSSGGLLLCIDTWMGDLRMRLVPTVKAVYESLWYGGAGHAHGPRGHPVLFDKFLQTAWRRRPTGA